MTDLEEAQSLAILEPSFELTSFAPQDEVRG